MVDAQWTPLPVPCRLENEVQTSALQPQFVPLRLCLYQLLCILFFLISAYSFIFKFFALFVFYGTYSIPDIMVILVFLSLFLSYQLLEGRTVSFLYSLQCLALVYTSGALDVCVEFLQATTFVRSFIWHLVFLLST